MKGKLTAKDLPKYKPQGKPFEVNDTELRGFCLRVMPTGGATYYFRYRLPNGQRGRVKIGSATALTPAEARAKAVQKAADAAKGIDPGQERKQSVPLTLGSFVEDEFYPLWLKSKRTGADTLRDMKTTFKGLWNVPLAEVTPGRVEKWRAGMIAGGAKPTSVNRRFNDLRSCLSRAVEWDRMSFHPLAKVKQLKFDHAPKVRYLDTAEEEALLAALDEREEEIRAKRDRYNKWRRERRYVELADLRKLAYADYLKPLVILSMNTGLRRGEAFNLQWADVDLDGGMLTVSGHGAKSGQTRHVPLNSVARATLEAWRDQVPPHGYVFPSPNGGRLDNVKTSWEGVIEKSGIEGFRWHDLRHHFASRLVMAGVDLNTVRELLGHSDIKMTLRYAHLAPEHTSEAVERIAEPRDAKVVRFPRKKREAHE